MAPVIFDSADIYIDQGTDLRAKIVRTDAIIDALFTAALKAAARGAVSMYELDDGQSKVKTMYRNATEVQNAITAFERIKQMYVNRLNGHMVRLVDQSNFNYLNYYGNGGGVL